MSWLTDHFIHSSLILLVLSIEYTHSLPIFSFLNSFKSTNPFRAVAAVLYEQPRLSFVFDMVKCLARPLFAT